MRWCCKSKANCQIKIDYEKNFYMFSLYAKLCLNYLITDKLRPFHALVNSTLLPSTNLSLIHLINWIHFQKFINYWHIWVDLTFIVIFDEYLLLKYILSKFFKCIYFKRGFIHKCVSRSTYVIGRNATLFLFCIYFRYKVVEMLNKIRINYVLFDECQTKKLE